MRRKRGPKRHGASLDDLLVQARITNRLLAAELRDKWGLADVAELLTGTEASNKEIAAVLGTSEAVINVTLTRRRKRAQEKPRKAKQSPEGETHGEAQSEAAEVPKDDLCEP